jgi:hypothetical protein
MKLFSLDEANALLPTVRRLFNLIDRERTRLKRLAPEAKRAYERAEENGGTQYGPAYAQALALFLSSAQELLSLGVEIKDFERGLCDFPHWRDGRVVYLCWQRGEEQIEWWHDVDAGFAGRQPLD